MRTAAIVGAAEFVKARLEANTNAAQPTGTATHPTARLHGRSNASMTERYQASNRAVIASVLKRADEPGELIAYWTSRYGRNLPKPVKRGIEDALGSLYTERNLLKYDTDSKGYRFGDVIELVHPAPKAVWQGDLFEHAIDRRHNRDKAIPESLPMLHARAHLMGLPPEQRRAQLTTVGGTLALLDAGMTWEAVAGWLQGPMDAQAWESVIPSMGYMALLRNLRNFDQAGVCDEVAEKVAALLADPEQVAKSRQVPFRFWSAYKHTQSLRWAHALEKGLARSLANVPALGGRTLILVDRSPSMFPGYGFSTPNKSDIPLAEQAAVFGAALAIRAADPTLVEFGMRSGRVDVPKGGSVLRLIEQFGRIDGTDIPSAVKQHYAGHDRVVIVTDEQSRPGWLPSNCYGHWGGMPETQIDDLIPKHVPVYMWNMAGYKPGAMKSGGQNRHTMGGLTDHAFRLIPPLESGVNGTWPWEQTTAA
ncbi:TROVE domain-containing protein [Kitasatospora sp. NPDC051170]|uniref:TROVE domain-containing protein n=1 Tax=Kitasatospora sp. NPDC051170 TaxID=3364056 RepID=UPI0037BC14CA